MGLERLIFWGKMYAVGRLGSYISQGVYTVSGPFHPFGGAVDIIVVEQQDRTFKSSPWYVRFGKFQGVLKSKEKVVNISVDGVQADFHMYLDSRGQAYFLREVDCEEGDSLFYRLSPGKDADVAASNRRPLESKSCNYDDQPSNLIDVGKGKVVTRTGSQRSHILGLVLGRHSMKENSFHEEEDGSGVVRADSLQRAEIAADLLELEWSTNLAFSRCKKDNGHKIFNSDMLATEADKDSQIIINNDKNGEIGIDPNETDTRSRLRFQNLGSCNEDIGVEMSSFNHDIKEESCDLDSPTSRDIDELVLTNVDDYKNVNLCTSETINPVLDSVDLAGVPEEVSGAEAISEVKSLHESSLSVAKESLDSSENLVDNDFEESFTDGPPHSETSSNSFANGFVMETCSEASKANRTIVSVNLSDFENLLTQETVTVAPVEEVNVSPSQGVEEEILLFGEPDDLNYSKDVSSESISSTHIIEDNSLSAKTVCEEEDDGEKACVVSSSISIPNRFRFEGIGRMAESLPNMWPPMSNVVLDNLQHLSARSLDSKFEASKQNAPVEDSSSCIESDAEKHDEVTQLNVEDSQIKKELNNVSASIPVGDQSKAADLSNGGWRVWPFSFKRSKSMNNTKQIWSTRRLDVEINLESTICMEEEKDAFKPEVKKTKKVRVFTPTHEQLASLKLKEGMNTVTFTFYTAMLGPQQVEARIFLWKWDTRIVISDVDGTITKSDMLGQFMPMVGMDWSHTGVAHLYSAIKENGYQLLFLSARAISQAHLTRQFLFNLKQDGKALPNGPVVISPDGLFPSLFREVIRRAPHEFKIACLEDIKALFPPDRSPFYAGFGNRDTDEISYLKVGIPKGKIFIINPKGEVVVNRRVDRKSYTSLKALVHDMFPPMSSSEQEDYNSWNFWKLPPPLIDV